MIDQYIVPEDTSEWAELMNMDCKKRTPEIPHFFEEFSRGQEARAEVVAKTAVFKLPDFVLNLLEADDETYELVRFETDRKGDDTRYGILEYALTADPQKEAPFVNEDIVNEIVDSFGKPETGFVIFNDGDETPRGYIVSSEYAYVVFYIDGAYSFLVKKGDPISPLLLETLPETLHDALAVL
jgi:hypothetical protein